MHLDDFDFDLPEDLIATRPVSPRTAARLLVAGPDGMTDARVHDLPGFLRPGDRLILNDTRVLPVRLTGTRQRATTTGSGSARIEVTLLEPVLAVTPGQAAVFFDGDRVLGRGWIRRP